MLVIGIDTSTDVGGIGLVQDGRLVAEYTLTVRRTHSELVMASVDTVLRDVGALPRDLAGVCAATGPGSFTGLRIAITTAQVMGYSLGIQVVGVPTLDAMAYGFAGYPGLVVPALDAKHGRVYTAIYCGRAVMLRTAGPFSSPAQQGGGSAPGASGDGRPEAAGLELLSEPEVIGNGPLLRLTSFAAVDVEALAAAVSRAACMLAGGDVLLLGDGALRYGDLLEEFAPKLGFVRPPEHQMVPRGGGVAMVGYHAIAAGKVDGGIAPMYLKRPEAEILWEKRHRRI